MLEMRSDLRTHLPTPEEYVASREAPSSGASSQSLASLQVAAMNREHEAWTLANAPDVFTGGGVE